MFQMSLVGILAVVVSGMALGVVLAILIDPDK